MTMVRTGDDKFTEKFKDRMIPEAMKAIQSVLGGEDELNLLTRLYESLDQELREWQDRYNKIEFTMRIILYRISAIEKEQKTRVMVERGYFIEGEL